MSTPSPSPSSNPSPIRIYVLWHPGLDWPEDFKHRSRESLTDAEKLRVDRGITLARRIYHWFRMSTMDGIPVYFRSKPESPDQLLPPKICDDSGVRNFIVPLVDSNMVSSPEWRSFVAGLADQDDASGFSTSRNPEGCTAETRVLPVAVESVAYNMPDSMRRLNFIRHVAGDAKSPPDDMELLSKLTEVICRDLRYWLKRGALGGDQKSSSRTVPSKIKIFLSHAKADDTEEAVAIKEYIQRETQCEAFFDETDIASGYNFGEILGTALSDETAGLIVVQGDNYADRPWCRKEIREFLTPEDDSRSTAGGARQYFIPPVVVVQTMKGEQIGRTIAELGYSPCVRWQAKASQFVVTTLLREILFGLFYRILAHSTAANAMGRDEAKKTQVYINRAPDPVMVNRILKKCGGKSSVTEIVHPGYGLSKMEREGLESSIDGIRFTPFLEINTGTENISDKLAGEIIGISVGNSDDILSRGLGDEHVQELVIRLIRPLIAKGASLLYGGAMPDTLRSATPWTKPVNFTGALLQLLVTERDGRKSNAPPALAPRLFVPISWHERRSITVNDIALWTDISSFIRISSEDSKIDPERLPKSPSPPDEADLADDTVQDRRAKRKKFEDDKAEHAAVGRAAKALSLSAMRRKICDQEHPLTCQLPDATAGNPSGIHEIRTLAHILIGGKTRGFSGLMPGVFEEALIAFDAEKPVFLIAEGGGAAALLAKWLIDFKVRPKDPPEDFTVNAYGGDKEGTPYASILSGLKHEAFPSVGPSHPAQELGRLWGYIRKVKDDSSLNALLKNGLKGDHNVKLLQSSSSQEISTLVWKGINSLVEPAGNP